MSNLSFSPLHVNNLTINNTYSFIKSCVDISIPVRTHLGEITNAALTNLLTDNDSFGLQINKNQKSAFTDELKPLDKERDADGMEINRGVTFHLKGRDAEKRAKASTMKLFLTPYWNAHQLPMNTQTGIVSEMLGKYKANPELVAAAKELGIDTLFTSYEAKNNAFDAVYKNRNNEVSGSEVSGSSLKPTVVVSFNTFSTAVEQAVNLTPNDTTLALFYKLDDFRKKYHALESGKNAPEADSETTK
jgi:hypothetical protein